MFRVVFRFAVVAATMVLAACDSPAATELSSLPSSESLISSASVSTGTVSLLVGEQQALRTSGSSSRSRVVFWRSDNENVAKVNASGNVIGLGVGQSVVTASYSGTTDSFLVAVDQVNGVSITATKTALVLAEKLALTASITNAAGGDISLGRTINWSVASGSAVSVASDGMVMAVESGSAVVAATVGGVTGIVMLTVASGRPDPSAPVVTSFSISPKPVTLVTSATQQFTANATWSDGVSRSFDVTYAATGGTVDLSGLYRAGQVAGAFSVIANCGCGHADTATISVLPSSAPAALTSLQVTPKQVSLTAGASQQLTVQAAWSDNVERAANVGYAATAGAVSASGLYTAPGVPGAYRIIASHVGGTLADTVQVTVTNPGTGSAPTYVAPAPPAAFVNVSYPTLTGVSRLVGAGGDLQAALNAAQPGDEVVLANGATFTGNFILPSKPGSTTIVVRAQTSPTSPGVRVSPGSIAGRARVITPNSQAAISTALGAKHWRLVGFEVTQAYGLSINYGLVVLGVGDEPTHEAQPSNIVLDRMYVHGTPNDQLKRCVAFNGDSLAVIDSWLSECHGKGFDAQAVAGWSGGGPYLIENNRMEASGETILFGGADPSVQSITPSDITIRRNYLYKPLSWGGGRWSVKLAFELKNAKRVLFEGNVIENHWADAQEGYAILFQVISDNFRAWQTLTVEDVIVRNNIIKNSTSGINLLSRIAYGGPLPPHPTSRIAIVNNLFLDVGRDPVSSAGGKLFQLLGDLKDITILNNTGTSSTSVYNGVSMDGTAQERLTMANNVFPATNYGIIGAEVGVGKPALQRFAPGSVVIGNVFPAQPAELYPSGNFFPASWSLINFANSAVGDFTLSTSNPFYNSSLGRVGVDYAAVAAAVQGVVQ